MNKYFFLIIFSINSYLYSQQGFVGINTNNPTARLEVHTNGNDFSTLGLKMRNINNIDIFKLYDNGYLGINTTPATVLDILGSSDGNDLLIEKPITTTTFNGSTIKPSFRHMKYAPAGNFNNANYGGQLMLFDLGYTSANNVVSNGIYIVPANPSVPAGLYLGSNRFNGFSLNRLPTTDLDVGGSIRLREYSTTITAGTSCVNRQGEMLYSKGHFYGCDRTNTWNQLDN